MQIYRDGGASNLVAGLLAFLPITLGEVGLAVLEHLFAHDAPQSALATVQPAHAVAQSTQPETAVQPLQLNDALQPAPATVQPEIAQDDAKERYLQRRRNGEPHMDLCRELQLVPSTAASWWRRMQLAAAQMQPAAQDRKSVV